MNKHLYLLVALVFSALTSYGDMRIFTDLKGRSIEAKLVNYEADSNTVTIQRKGTKKTTRVSLSIFSKGDQKFVREWGKLQALQDSRLKAVIRRFSEKDKKNTRGSSASTSVVTDEGFTIRLENGTKKNLENIELKYAIFYEQERHVGAGSVKTELKQGCLVKDKVISIPARDEFEMTTETVKLRTWKTYSLAPIDSDVHGIRIRLTLTLESGEKTTRDFAYPSSLKQPWRSETVDAAMKYSN